MRSSANSLPLTVWALLALIVFPSCLHAQKTNYSFTSGSGTYSPLAGSTALVKSSKWNAKGYTIPIGFSFSIMDKSFDSVTISPNGLLKFGDDNKRAIAAYTGIVPVKDAAGNWSQVSYLSANDILKIEFRNMGFGNTEKDEFTFQVWLHKGGNKVEFHTGPNNLSALPDSVIMPVVGIVCRSSAKVELMPI